MKTNVHSNSIETYHADKMYISDRDAIIEYSLTVRHFTDTMLAKAINRPQSTLSSKRASLVKEGILVKELDKHPCKITTNNAMYFYNPVAQMRLM